MGRCGPGDVLVVEAHTFDEYSCILGNMKTRMLWHQNAEGLVTDGAIRDLQMIVDDYDLSVFAGNRSPAGKWNQCKKGRDGSDPGVQAFGSKQRLVPAFMQNRKPLCERNRDQQLVSNPGGQAAEE